MIEERLRDAFGAAARTVQPETLRPLIAPDGLPMPRTSRRWPVPVIAAATMAVIVAGSVAVFQGDTSTDRTAGALAGIPSFFVTSELQDGRREPSRLLVRDSVTGKVRGTVSGSDHGLSFRHVTATGDGRTFIVTAKSADQTPFGRAGTKTDDCRVRTYRLQITGSGKISRFAQIPDAAPIELRQSPVGSLVASRDGNKIAYSGQGCGDHRFKIIVRDVPTGAVREWVDQGTTNIADLSWLGDGRHLAYSRFEMAPPDGTRARGDELLLLDTAAAGGAPVPASRTLLRLSGELTRLSYLTVDPSGSRIFALNFPPLRRPTGSGKVGTPPEPTAMSVVEIANDRVARTLYRWTDEPRDPTIARRALRFDTSGRHLLVLRGAPGGEHRLLSIDNGVARPLRGGEQAYDIAW